MTLSRMANVMTAGNALFGVIGIVLALNGMLPLAGMALIFAAILDVFDGVVARLDKKRPDSSSKYGSIADSVADAISFGVLPATMVAHSANYSAVGIAIALWYVGTVIFRLIRFTLQSLHHNRPVRTFQGFPVPVSAVIFPLVIIMFYQSNFLSITLLLTAGALGYLFISSIPFPKPSSKKALGVIVIISIVLTIGLLWRI